MRSTQPFPIRTALEALLAVALFGCIPVVVRSISANAWTIGIFRLAVAAAGLALLMAARREIGRISLRDLMRLAIIGFLFFAHWATFFLAIKASSASIAAIGLSTYGVDLLILSAIAGVQRARATDVVAVILAAAGAILVVPSFDLGDEIALGMALASISAVFYATLPLLHQRWSHLTTKTRALGQFSFALLFFLLFAGESNWDLSGRDWGGLLFLAIGPTLIAHSLWVRVTTRFSPSTTSIVYYGNIPFAVVLSVVLLGEPLTARTLAGGLMIVGGGIFGLAFRRAAPPHEAVVSG